MRKCNKDKRGLRLLLIELVPVRQHQLSLPETIKTELLGADRLVASGGAAASSQPDQLQQPGCLAASAQLARTI